MSPKRTPADPSETEELFPGADARIERIIAVGEGVEPNGPEAVAFEEGDPRVAVVYEASEEGAVGPIAVSEPPTNPASNEIEKREAGESALSQSQAPTTQERVHASHRFNSAAYRNAQRIAKGLGMTVTAYLNDAIRHENSRILSNPELVAEIERRSESLREEERRHEAFLAQQLEQSDGPS